MNCHTCGTPLSLEETHCSRCGTPTPYSYSMTHAAPDDTTIVSSSQSLYEPLHVTPPSPLSPRKRSKRIGIIIAAILLVLLVGGGVFAWREFSAGNQTFTAKGTGTILSSTPSTVLQDGNNQISHLTQQIISYGDITGSFTNEETFILYPDKTGTFSGKSTCTCTVAGRSGTLIWSFTGTQAADGSSQGKIFDFQGTNDLAGLHGQGTFQVQGSHDTYSSELSFAS